MFGCSMYFGNISKRKSDRDNQSSQKVCAAIFILLQFSFLYLKAPA